MLSLIKKEIYEKSDFLLGMLISVLFLASGPFLITMDETGEGLSGIFAFMYLPLAYMMVDFAQGIIVADETKTAAYFWGSTPKGKEGIVGAKYLFTLMMCLGTTLYIFVLTLIFGDMKTIMSIALGLAIFQIYLKSVELPFIFTFGAKQGIYIKVCLVTLIIFLILGYGLFGYIPEDLNFSTIMDWIGKLLADENLDKKLKIIGAVSGGLALALFYFSYKISCRGYWHGVEEYES